MIDFHSHILPGIDDGSAGPEESLALLRQQWDQGVTHTVLTPHFYPRRETRPEEFLRRRREALELLREEAARTDGIPTFSLGCEVHFFRGMSGSEILQELTMEGTPYLLVEMPGGPWSEEMYRELEAIHRNQGLVPVIAHIDRYIAPFRAEGILRRLEKIPVLLQANADFFLDAHTRRLALKLLKNHRLHLLGSDCHNLKHRPPRLGEATEVIRRHLGPEILEQMDALGKELLELH